MRLNAGLPAYQRRRSRVVHVGVARHLSIGVSTSWHWFAQNFQSRTVQYPDAAVTASVYDRVQLFTLRASIHWYPTGETGEPATDPYYPSFEHLNGDVIHGSLERILAEAAKDESRKEDIVRELKELLAKAIDMLPEKEKQLIALYYYEELTMKEIGATLDLSESRVSQMHSSIVARLQQQLAKRRPEFSN